MICAACGATNRTGQEFCTACHDYLGWDAARESPEPPVVRRRVEDADERQPAPAAVPALAQPTAVRSPHTPIEPDPACRSCGRANPPSRRFCGGCGATLQAGRAVGPTPVSSVDLRARLRRGRRAYRRSLPALYSWRRVIITVVSIMVVIAGAVITGRHPVKWGIAQAYGLTGRVDTVRVDSVSVDPADATDPQTTPDNLKDGTKAEWATRWEPTAKAKECAAAPGTASVTLTFPKVRIQHLMINAGLLDDRVDRRWEYRPHHLGVTYGGQPCQRWALQDTGAEQPIYLDSQTPVSSLQLVIIDAYSPDPDHQTKWISITELRLLSRR